MNHYIYDGSFEGLLTVCFYAYKDSDIYAISTPSSIDADLLSTPVHIPTEQDKANRVFNSVLTKISPYVLHTMQYVHLSELPNCDLLVLQYLRLCYQIGPQIQFAKQHPIVRKAEDYRFKVTKEFDRIKGFLRFQEIDQLVFYADFEPDHNQLPLLGQHLSHRFSDQKMIVHDKKRNRALLYDLQQCTIIPFNDEDQKKLFLYRKEDSYSDLFQQYYQAVTIQDRTNLRLQTQYMPIRYRKYMPETQS